jgi:hypothetical protein
MNGPPSQRHLSVPDMQAILAVTCKPEAPFDLMSMLSEVVSAAKQVLKADRGSVWLPVASSMAAYRKILRRHRPSGDGRLRPSAADPNLGGVASPAVG